LRHRLRLASWGTTNACNLRCVYCYRGAGARESGELTTDEALEMIRELRDLGCRTLVLSGGEPLLRGDVLEVAREGARLGLQVVMASNGTMIGKEEAEAIRDAGVRCVSIAINGARAETHEALTGVRGSFEAALKGARACVEAGLDLQVNTVATTLNFGEVLDVISLASELGAKYMHIFHFVPTGRGEAGLEVPADDFNRLLYEVMARQGSLGRPLIKPTCAPQYWAYLARLRPRFAEEFLRMYPRGCVAGTSYVYISPTGDVYPCPYLPIRLGNVRSEGLREIWLESPVLEELRDRSLLRGRCGSCEFRDICGGCRARAYARTGDYLGQDPACAV